MNGRLEVRAQDIKLMRLASMVLCFSPCKHGVVDS